MSQHALACLVTDRQHTLTRIVGLCARRACRIESIRAGQTEIPGVLRINLVVEADRQRAENLLTQLGKLVDVLLVEASVLGSAPGRERAAQDSAAVAGDRAQDAGDGRQSVPPGSASTASRFASDSVR